jgi:hypothetical protein
MPTLFHPGSCPPLVVEDDVFDRDTVAVDSWLPAAGARGTHNPHAVWRRTRRRLGSLSLTLARYRFHNKHLNRTCPKNEHGRLHFVDLEL